MKGPCPIKRQSGKNHKAAQTCGKLHNHPCTDRVAIFPNGRAVMVHRHCHILYILTINNWAQLSKRVFTVHHLQVTSPGGSRPLGRSQPHRQCHQAIPRTLGLCVPRRPGSVLPRIPSAGLPHHPSLLLHPRKATFHVSGLRGTPTASCPHPPFRRGPPVPQPPPRARIV